MIKRDILYASWWKYACVIFLTYTVIAGFFMPIPQLSTGNLYETVRNLYFHVCMWFAMMFIFSVSLFYSIRYLNNPKEDYDVIASQSIYVGLIFGILGLFTGGLWANYTWETTPGSAGWISDPKIQGTIIALLSYFAYVVLRNAMDDEHKRARISAVYNIFAYVMMIVFIMIFPRLSKVDSIHPGNGGNPGFNSYDLDSHMRMVFYPAVIGWILLCCWITSINIRTERIKRYIHNI